MQITSSVFIDGEALDHLYSHDGENINPPLTFSEIPPNTQSLSLIVEDLDSVHGTFTHWLLYNMSPATLQITEGELPVSGTEGKNDAGIIGYFGPKPTPGSGTHRYVFRLLALDTQLEFADPSAVNRIAFDEAIDGHVIKTAEITGTFSSD
jgi:Raf kinase inhibitor-like YbhB/YbcL family protein